MTRETNPLIGKIIAGVYLSEDKKAIKFETDSGELIVGCEGDCCSETWIEGVDLPDALLGKVTSVENLDLPEKQEEKSEWDVVKFYGCAITTSKGRCTIDYRNSSNGYYGGNLVWPGDYSYGGVFGQNESCGKWVKLV